jgi:hypothetical protein
VFSRNDATAKWPDWILGPHPARLAQLILFLFLGALLAFACITAFARIHHDPVLVASVILLTPALGVYAAFAFEQAVTEQMALMRQLKWWHFLWLAVFLSGLVFRQRSAASAYNQPVDNAAVYRIFLVFTVALWLMLRLFLRRTHWVQSLFQGLVGGLTIYSLYAAVTTMWSVYPLWSLYKGCEYSVDVALLAAILVSVRSVESYKSLFDWTWTLLGLALASAWLGVVFDPQDALDHYHFVGILGVRLKGVIPVQGANRIGDLGAILALVALARLFPIYGRCSRRSWYSFLLLFGFVSLIFSQTRTALAGFAVGVCVLLFVSGRLGLRKILTVGLATGIVAAVLYIATPAGDLLTDFLRRGQPEQQLATLSSRVLWWETAWNLYKQTPLGIGMGAYAAERVPSLTVIGLQGESLHSDYMETILGTGFWGLLPLLVSLAGTWFVLLRALYHSALSHPERQLAIEAAAVLSLLTVRTIFMDIMILHPALHYFAVVGFAELLRRRHAGNLSY